MGEKGCYNYIVDTISFIKLVSGDTGIESVDIGGTGGSSGIDVRLWRYST